MVIWPAINEGLMLLSAAAAAVGWYQIRHGRTERHRRLMLIAAGAGAAFFGSYVSRSLLVGDTPFGGPPEWRGPYLVLLALHVVIATVAGGLGVMALRRALSRRFVAHRRVAPWAVRLWFAAAATGLVVFLLLYLVFPPGAARL